MISAVGLITEYNPFHNGHFYHATRAKELSGADYSIAVMSGDFTQRGEFSMADKYTRARGAIASGVDAVFELPVPFATGSAMDFADGAVAILSSLKIVSHVAFGVETDDMELFDSLSCLLADEPAAFQEALRDAQKTGLSFPAARARAVKQLCGNKYESLLSLPNNTLGLQYMIALKKQNSSIQPILIPRLGSGYHENAVSDSRFPSASAVRSRIEHGEPFRDLLPEQVCEALGLYSGIPNSVSLSSSRSYESIILHLLMKLKESPSDLMDCTEEIMNKIRKLNAPLSLQDVISALTSRNVTATRIHRILLHLLLGISNEDRSTARSLLSDYPYLNLLGFRLASREALHAISENSSSALISKKSAYIPQTQEAGRLWSLDTNAHSVYSQILFSETGIRIPNELASTPVIIR